MLKKKLKYLRKNNVRGSLWKLWGMNSLQFNKTSELYHNELFTVVPRSVDIRQGIFPDDQGMNKKSVVLWDNVFSLILFPDDKYKIISVEIPHHIKYSRLHRLIGSTYTLPYISNKWKLEEVTSLPLYST